MWRPGRADLIFLSSVALGAFLRKNKLCEHTPVGQAALKIVQAQVEVVAFYHRLPPSLTESSCGEIGLLDYGEAAYFKSGAHFRGAHKKARLLVACPGQRKRWSSAGPSRNLVA